MDEDQWTYDSLMYGELDIDFDDEQQCGVNEGPCLFLSFCSDTL